MSGDEAYVRVPVGAFKWLMGEEGDFVPPPDAKGNFWWRSEFQRRIKNFAFCWTPPKHEMCPLCREIAKNRAQSKRKRERKHRKAA